MKVIKMTWSVDLNDNKMEPHERRVREQVKVMRGIKR